MSVLDGLHCYLLYVRALEECHTRKSEIKTVNAGNLQTEKKSLFSDGWPYTKMVLMNLVLPSTSSEGGRAFLSHIHTTVKGKVHNFNIICWLISKIAKILAMISLAIAKILLGCLCFHGLSSYKKLSWVAWQELKDVVATRTSTPTSCHTCCLNDVKEHTRDLPKHFLLLSLKSTISRWKWCHLPRTFPSSSGWRSRTVAIGHGISHCAPLQRQCNQTRSSLEGGS